MKSKIIAFLFLLAPALSFSQIHRPGLLTDDYGVVTKQDLDEDEEQCTEVEPFPPHFGCMMYWQCLSTRDMKIVCDSHGPDLGHEFREPGVLILTIKDRGETHEYQGRHNNGMAECKAMKGEMLKVVANEKIVCISGEFVDKEGQTSGWIIDRMKSHHGEWSWFQRKQK